MNARAELIGEANAELKELEAKDDLTAEEVQRAEFLRNAVKQQNVEMLQLDRIKKWEEELQKYEEEHSELTESEWAQQQQRQGIQEAKTLQKGRMPVRGTVPQAPVREQPGDQAAVEPAEQTPATENAGSNPEHIRRIMYQGYVRSVDEAVRELKLEGMSIELIETAAALPEHIRSKPGALRAEGAYDQQTGTVYLVAENLAPSRVGKVLLHEAVGHKGLHQIFGKRYGSFLEQIANDHADGVAAVASRRGLDLMDPAQRIEAADEFLAEMAETRGGEDVSVWKRIVAAVRGFFRRMGFHATWTDDEIADLFRQSRKTLKRNRAAKGEAARLAIFGEEGVRRMENAIQLLENLATAKQMTAEGKDAKVIKLATGWELGGDGKWRMEMPDAVFTTRAKLPDGAEYDRTLWDVVNTTNGKLSEYVVADEIFEAYPELKDYHFQIGQMPSGVGGSFNPDTKTIYINQLGLTSALKMVDDAQARLSDETLTAAERKSAQHSVDLWTEQIFSMINETLVHEVQHAIQHIEGFATGSNVRHFIDHPEYDPKRLEKVSYYSEKFESARQNLEKYPELKKMVDRYVELEDVLFSDDNVQVDEAAIDAEMDQIKAHFESIGKRELLMDYISGRDNYKMAKDAAEKHKLDPVESYRRTAGEVEARNVQERMDMTMEERLNSLLSETEDVAEKDKIYLNGLVRGGSEMAADRPYYKVPFSEGLRDAVDPAKKNERSPVFVTTTGSILQELGFTALPMMMNRRHLRLNYYSRENFERIYGKMHKGENAHALGLNLEKIVSALEHPLAVVVNTRKNAKAGSVVVITDINVNRKKVVIPVLVEAVSQAKNQDIDAHLVLTVYDSKDWMGDFLEPAVEIEKSGNPGVFYTDPKKAEKYSALSLGKKGTVLSGFTGHTIQDIGINVKSQSETLQFKSWFGDSKVVDENGKPLVVYHGTNWDGWEFDTENGAFFSEKEDYAEEMAAQRGGSRTVKAYLSIKNPLVVKVPGNKMADPEFEARIIAEAKSKGHDGVKLETDTNNEIEKDVFWVAFEPNQIKSATDNVGTFDPGNNDVRFSVAPDEELELDRVNQAFNNELQKQIDGELPKGYLYQLGRPGSILRSTGIPDLPIEMSATRLAEKANTEHHLFDIEDVKDLPLYLNKPIGVFEYGNKDKAQNIVVEIQKEDKHFIVGLSLNFKHDGLVVNSIRGLYPKDTHEWLTWIQKNKSLYLNKEKIQALIAQQQTNPADVNYLDLDLISKIVRDFQNASVDEENSSRLSVAPDDAFVQAWAKVLLPVVSTQYINVDGAAAYLMDHGIEVYAGRDDDTLRKACVLAQTWKKERNKVVRGNREHKALEKKDPYYKILSGKFGRDFQINAGPKYDGTVFTGTWMDKHKTEKGRSGSITAATKKLIRPFLNG